MKKLKNKKRIAAIGDVHGCIDEFLQLLKQLEWLSLDEIWCLGDLVDRGPDSGAVVQHCRENYIPSIMGNHDDSILGHYKRFKKSGKYPSNPDKERTLRQLSNDDLEYLNGLPPIHVFDDIGLILVHAGVWPGIPLYEQPLNVIRAQLIQPLEYGRTRWWGTDATKHTCKKTEDQSRKEGWERWYRLYDYEHDCVYGHSVWSQPKIDQRKGFGRTVGVDNGSCFGGLLTAGIYDGDDWSFLSVKVRECYTPQASRVLTEE